MWFENLAKKSQRNQYLALPPIWWTWPRFSGFLQHDMEFKNKTKTVGFVFFFMCMKMVIWIMTWKAEINLKEFIEVEIKSKNIKLCCIKEDSVSAKKFRGRIWLSVIKQQFVKWYQSLAHRLYKYYYETISGCNLQLQWLQLIPLGVHINNKYFSILFSP